MNLKFAIGSGLALLLSACATANYMGIDTTQPNPVSELARSAQAGDKVSQLALGIKFEEGDGLPLDWHKAMKLYSAAAKPSGGKMWVYTPSVGSGTKGRVIPVDMGSPQAGLNEAIQRLQRLRTKLATDKR